MYKHPPAIMNNVKTLNKEPIFLIFGIIRAILYDASMLPVNTKKCVCRILKRFSNRKPVTNNHDVSMNMVK